MFNQIKLKFKSAVFCLIISCFVFPVYAEDDVKYIDDYLPYYDVFSTEEVAPAYCANNKETSIYNSLVSCTQFSSCDINAGLTEYVQDYKDMPVYALLVNITKPLIFFAVEFDQYIVIYGDGLKELPAGIYGLPVIMPSKQSELKAYGYPWTNALTIKTDGEFHKCVVQSPTLPPADPNFKVNGSWSGKAKYCASGNCQTEAMSLTFKTDGSWVGSTTMTTGLIYKQTVYYDLKGTYQISGSKVIGTGNVKLKTTSSWDSSDNIKFELTKDSSGNLNGSWDDGSGADIQVTGLRQLSQHEINISRL
ncbi:MAG: hypothetical protein HQK63_15580 [Desulfamplus sp.]|nr:hypothetical protein [Desulfamplus sp.]